MNCGGKGSSYLVTAKTADVGALRARSWSWSKPRDLAGRPPLGPPTGSPRSLGFRILKKCFTVRYGQSSAVFEGDLEEFTSVTTDQFACGRALAGLCHGHR